MEDLLFRYYPAKGLRKRNCGLGTYDGREIRSEDFETDEEFCLAVASDLLDLIQEDRERNEDDSANQPFGV